MKIVVCCIAEILLSVLWKEPHGSTNKTLIKPILSHETTPLRLALYTFGDVHVQQVQEVPPGKRHGCTRILECLAMPDFSGH